MLLKELIKIAACLLGGLILAIASPIDMLGVWNYVLLPLYILGLAYGVVTVIPWIGKTIGSMSKMFMYSVIMKSLIGVILLVLMMPLFLAALLILGWFVGMVKLVQRMGELIQQQVSFGSQRENLHKRWGESSPPTKKGGGDPYEFFPDIDEEDNWEQRGDSSDSGYDEYDEDSNYNFEDDDDF